MRSAVMVMSLACSLFKQKGRKVVMCYKGLDLEMAGLHEGHLRLLEGEASLSHLPQHLVRDVFGGLTENLNPHLPTLTAIVAMIEAVRKGDFGVLGEHRLVRLPLSIIGTDHVRYRTPVMEWLHESILSMRMSDITIDSLRRELRPRELCIMFMCSCGVVMGKCDDVRAYYGSEHHRRMDRLRSTIDAAGNPVSSVQTFDEIPVETMDLCSNGAEQRLFRRVEELTRLAAQAGRTEYDWTAGEIDHFVAQAQQGAPVGV